MKKNLNSVIAHGGVAFLMVCVIATCLWAGNRSSRSPQTNNVTVDPAAAPRQADTVIPLQNAFGADEFIVLDPQSPSTPKATASLGVHVRHADATLRHHLGLDDGVGLVIEHVKPDGAAAQSGLRRHEVLKKIDDQILINDQQLHTLIRMQRPGDEIRLTVVRAGKTEEVVATLQQGPGSSEIELFKDYWQTADAHAQLAKAHDFSDPSMSNCSNCHKTYDAYRRN